MNDRDVNIKFTLTFHTEQITFLDIFVKKSPVGWITSVFRKSIDKNAVLHYNSAHPLPLKDSLPLSQFIRYRRNCSDLHDFKSQVQQLKNNFFQRGYPHKVINRAYKRALHSNRDLLLHTRDRGGFDSTIQPVNLVTKFTPLSFHLKHSVRRHMNVLHSIASLEYHKFDVFGNDLPT